MYTVNRLMRNVLITPEEVMYHAPTKETVDERMIKSSIIVAEERWVRPELGFELYDDLCTAKNVVVTPANKATLQIGIGAAPVLQDGDIVNAYELMSPAQQTLWKQHLWKLLAECVITAALTEGFIQFGSEGATHNNPPAGLMVTSGFVTPLLTSMKWVVDKKIQDRVGPLVQSLHNYLCKFKTDFPLYIRECPDCNKDVPHTKWVGLALNLYDDEIDDVNCCP